MGLETQTRQISFPFDSYVFLEGRFQTARIAVMRRAEELAVLNVVAQGEANTVTRKNVLQALEDIGDRIKGILLQS